MTVWADADSLPREVRDMIARRAMRENARDPAFTAVFTANRPVGVREGRALRFILASPEEGAADEVIMGSVAAGDLVVTRDIPLAERILAALGDSVGVVNDRGGRFSPDSVRERRSLRDAMLELRLSGLAESGKAGYGRKEAAAFARAFDAELARLRSGRKA